jgi:AraC-like DNA-binding protein
MASDKKRRVKPKSSRVIMLIETSNYLNRLEGNQFSIFTQKFHLSAAKTLKEFDGSILKKDNSSYLVSFDSVSDAILCAVKVQFKFKYVTPKFDANIRRLNIALILDDSGFQKKTISDESTRLVTRLCEIVKDQVVVSARVRALYDDGQSEALDQESIRCLTYSEEVFLTVLMDYMQVHWNDSDLDVSKLSKEMRYSRSQLYRRLMSICGMSSSTFIREFRLHKALGLLHRRSGSIAQIARKTGFKSPSYFTKVFTVKYGILPSKYAQQHGS